jgi:hypothetical protein
MTSTVPDLCHPQTETETTWDCAISNLRIAQELAANLDSKRLRSKLKRRTKRPALFYTDV